MLKIYHNPRCRNSRKGLQYLQEKGLAYELVNYFEDPFTPETLKSLLMKLNLKPSEVVRTQEDLYKHELKGKNFTDEELFADTSSLSPNIVSGSGSFRCEDT